MTNVTVVDVDYKSVLRFGAPRYQADILIVPGAAALRTRSGRPAVSTTIGIPPGSVQVNATASGLRSGGGAVAPVETATGFAPAATLRLASQTPSLTAIAGGATVRAVSGGMRARAGRAGAESSSVTVFSRTSPLRVGSAAGITSLVGSFSATMAVPGTGIRTRTGNITVATTAIAFVRVRGAALRMRGRIPHVSTLSSTVVFAKPAGLLMDLASGITLPGTFGIIEPPVTMVVAPESFTLVVQNAIAALAVDKPIATLVVDGSVNNPNAKLVVDG